MGMRISLTRAVVVVPATATPREHQAAALLVEEVQRRTGVRWEVRPEPPEGDAPAIVLGVVSRLRGTDSLNAAGSLTSGSARAEGYDVIVPPVRDGGEAPRVWVMGHDARGVFFGVGRLLRSLHMAEGSVEVDADLVHRGAPAYPVRGHQLGYRPKNNTYDAWSPEDYERYVRDLVVFGTNTIELMPPNTDDEDTNALMKVPKLEMLGILSRMLDRYDVDLSLWYPAMQNDYEDPAVVEQQLSEWGEVFERCERLDAVFVPGGDPGHTPPDVLVKFLDQVEKVLHRSHPEAEMWLSPQGFSEAWIQQFFALLHDHPPQWLTGLVYGPWTRRTLPRMREETPARYPIRLYPDIAHTFNCQFPVPGWDPAFMRTLGREPINPRPMGYARIHELLAPYTVGFVTYSEGANDDVNKFVWTALGFDPHADVVDILRDYARYFVGERYADPLAQGLLALEANWEGPLLARTSVDVTLAQFQDMERTATPAELQNWRLEQALYRAYYDAYVRGRLVQETAQELRALDRLRQARAVGSLEAIRQAEAILADQSAVTVGAGWRQRIEELAGQLFRDLGMQLSVARYGALARDRGANLDSLDEPLNNRPYLEQELGRIRAESSEPTRLEAIDRLLNDRNPGPGGFFDSPGDPGAQPHVLPGVGWEHDPYFLASSYSVYRDFDDPLRGERPGAPPPGSLDDDIPPGDDLARGIPGPLFWQTAAETVYGTPLQARYEHLDPTARYRLRVLYHGRYRATLALTARPGIQIHGPVPAPVPPVPLEYDIPPEATRTGTLELTWTLVEGRGAQVAGLWLMRR